MTSHENAGPPDALLAVPTTYRSYATDGSSADLDGLNSTVSDEFSTLEEGCARDVVIDDPEGKTAPPEIVAEDPKGKNLEPDCLGLPAPVERIGGPRRGEEGSNQKLPGNLASAVPMEEVNAVFPDDIVKPNPTFGNASDPVSQKIGVLNEDSVERRENRNHISVPATEVKTIPE